MTSCWSLSGPAAGPPPPFLDAHLEGLGHQIQLAFQGRYRADGPGPASPYAQPLGDAQLQFAGTMNFLGTEQDYTPLHRLLPYQDALVAWYANSRAQTPRQYQRLPSSPCPIPLPQPYPLEFPLPPVRRDSYDLDYSITDLPSSEGGLWLSGQSPAFPSLTGTLISPPCLDPRRHEPPYHQMAHSAQWPGPSNFQGHGPISSPSQVEALSSAAEYFRTVDADDICRTPVPVEVMSRKRRCDTSTGPSHNRKRSRQALQQELDFLGLPESLGSSEILCMGSAVYDVHPRQSRGRQPRPMPRSREVSGGTSNPPGRAELPPQRPQSSKPLLGNTLFCLIKSPINSESSRTDKLNQRLQSMSGCPTSRPVSAPPSGTNAGPLSATLSEGKGMCVTRITTNCRVTGSCVVPISTPSVYGRP